MRRQCVKLLNLSAFLRRWALKLLNFAPALRAGRSKSSYVIGPSEIGPSCDSAAKPLCEWRTCIA